MRVRSLLPTLLLAGCATMPPPGRDTPVAEASLAFSRSGEIAGFAHGLADPAAGRAATLDDPVRIASVSKLAVAIGVMKLVERGRLDLDQDVSATVGFTVAPPTHSGPPVTLRQLLGHTSGLRDHDDQYAIPLAERLADVLRLPASWDAAHPPGSGYFAYANMNYPVIASAMERATGERFDMWMRREVLAPLAIDGCFNWPTCSDAAVARAVVLTQDGKVVRDDLGGRQPDCPVFVREGRPCDLSAWRPGENGALFSPQGGLRISARGLARIGRMLLNGGELDGVRVLSPQTVDTLLAVAWRFDGGNGARDGESATICSYGLATQQLATPVSGCADDPEGRGRAWVGHAGEAYGLRSGLWLDRKRGVGIVYWMTGLPAALPRGRSAFSVAEERAFRRAAALLPR